jgi:hypothetical protein
MLIATEKMSSEPKQTNAGPTLGQVADTGFEMLSAAKDRSAQRNHRLGAGFRASTLLKKAHLLRCSRSPRYNVSVNTPPACPERSRRIDFSRASHLALFEQPGSRVFQHSAKLLRSELRSL